MIIPALAALVAAPPPVDEWEALRGRVEKAPREVAAFIERRAGCNHFLGEEPYDEARSAEIEEALRELGCERLKDDEDALRSTYQQQDAILQLLTDTADATAW